MERHLSSKTNKPHNKGPGEFVATEAGCLQQLARQDPQGEEATTPHTPTIPHTSLNTSYRVGSSIVDAADALLHANTSNTCTYSTSYAPSLLSSASYASINHENSGSKYSLNHSFLSDVQSNQPRSDLSCVPPNMNNSANLNYDVSGSSSASLLPEHFSQLSQNAQQQILEQILSAHSTITDGNFTSENENAFRSESGRCIAGTSRDSGIVGDLRGQPPDRQGGVGGARPPESSSSIVVSLPNHSSSLHMPESPGLPIQNESNASICSSNNTLVIHGSDSPDSPWSHKWSSALQHNTRTSNLSTPERVPYSSSGVGSMPPPVHQATALIRPDHHISRSVSLSQAPTNLSTQERVLNYISGHSTDITDIPNSLLDQSQVLKHLLTATNSNTPRSTLDARSMNTRSAANSHLDSNKAQVLNSSNHYTSLLKSSVSIGQSDRDGSFNKNRPTVDTNSSNTGNFLGASKLTSKSSSSGSVYSSHLDNVTPTSGYSSASASTQFSLNRSALTTAIDDGLLRYSLGPSSDDLPPPPAYPHWRVDKPSEPLPAANDHHLDAATTRENLRDISLGRGTSRDLASAGREETPRGRGLLSGVRDTRRDLSLGPEFGRMTISSGASRQNISGQELTSENEVSPTTAALSRSQPDLTRLNNNNNTKENHQTSPREMKLSQRLASSELPTVVDLLFNENTALRLELELYNRKVNKLQKFETEILKVHAAHESLVQICTRREQLEKLARTKLQNQVAVLTKTNIELEAGRGTEGVVGAAEDALRRELNRRDVVIAQLVAQNKEMLAAKERLEMEVTAQKQTLHEQRTHIDVLDSALANAQANIGKLEDEVRVKQGNVVQLQQAAADRRQLQADQDMHQRLQREMLLLRYQQCTGRQEGAKLSTETLERELQQWEQQQTMMRLRQEQLHLQHNRDRQQSMSQQRTPQGGRQQQSSVPSGGHQQYPQQQQQPSQQQQLPAPRRDEELERVRAHSQTAAAAITVSQATQASTSHLLVPGKQEQPAIPTSGGCDPLDRDGDQTRPPSAATPSVTSSTASGTTTSDANKSRSASTSSEDMLEREDGGCQDAGTEAVLTSSSYTPLAVPPKTAARYPVESGKRLSRPVQSYYDHPDRENLYANCDQQSGSQLYRDNYFNYSNEPEYMNYRPGRQDGAENTYFSNPVHDEEFSVNPERTNYSKYISRQFNKFKDATLYRGGYPKRLSYPLKHTNIDILPERSGESLFKLQDQFKYVPNSSRRYPGRPHSCVDFSPIHDGFPSSQYHTRDPDYHEYVNYSPPIKCEQNCSMCPSKYPSKPCPVPDYVDPPDYALHRRQKMFADRHPRDAYHEGSAPPVIIRGTNNDQETHQPYYERIRHNSSGKKIQMRSEAYSQQYQTSSDNSVLVSDGGHSFAASLPTVRLSSPPPSVAACPPTVPVHSSFEPTSSPSASSTRNSAEAAEVISGAATPVPRGNPPPYHSHHEILESSPMIFRNDLAKSALEKSLLDLRNSPNTKDRTKEIVPSTVDLPDVKVPFTKTPPEICRTNHPPNTTCKTCNNARSTYRKNAANLVRRASSGASLLKRKSAKLRSSFHTEVDLEETPSILARLRKEWQDRRGGSKSTGNIPTTSEGKNSNPSSTSSLSSSVQSKSSESLRYEFNPMSHNLSQDQWTITENQPMETRSRVITSRDQQYVYCNSNLKSPGSLAHNLTPSPSTVAPDAAASNIQNVTAGREEAGPGIQDTLRSASVDSANGPVHQTKVCLEAEKEESGPTARYYEIDISDDDSTYDTLIIKDVPDLNESQITSDCNCVETCAHLNNVTNKTKANPHVNNNANEANKIKR